MFMLRDQILNIADQINYERTAYKKPSPHLIPQEAIENPKRKKITTFKKPN
jgi:hypothetical protein